ncbi:unnamed protein product, partial [Closterium sp. NIES-54]
MQLRRRPTLMPRQLREWLYQHGPSPSPGRCPYVIRTGRRAGQTCGTPAHAESRCFAYLTDTWRTEFGDEAEIPPWLELLRSGVAVFALDYDAILIAMSALPGGAESDCHLSVQYDPSIEVAALGASEAAALGASESASSGTAPAEALHTFTLDSGASHCFFCESTALTLLPAPVAVSLWPSSCTVHHYASVPGGSVWLTDRLPPPLVLYKLAWGDLYVLPDWPGSSLYTLTTAPPQVAATGQVSASGQVASRCECRSLSHQTLLWHHHLGHPSLPRLRGKHHRLLVSGLPRSLPPLPASPAPPCLPCVEGRHRAALHSSSFPLTEAPLQTLHLDVWGSAHVRGQGGERYFLLVDDDYSRHTTVFPLRIKGEDLPLLRLHFDGGGECTSDLLRAFCQGEGIEQSFTLPGSPQQNGVAELCIGLVMELNLWPRISLPETSPTLRWTGEAGDASRFRVWGARALVRDMSADKLSSRTIPCDFLGFVPDAPGWQFYHPTSRRVFPSQDVTFDESVPFYRLFPYRTAPLPPSHFSLLQVDPPPLAGPIEVTSDSGATAGGVAGGAASGGAEPAREVLGSAEPGGAEPAAAESGGAEPVREVPGGVEPGGAESAGVPL